MGTVNQAFFSTCEYAISLSNYKLCVSLTLIYSHSGHAEDLGVNFDYETYDSVLFIRFLMLLLLHCSGDGTVNEFLNGILSRNDARKILFACTFALISAGSQNSLARGMGTGSYLTALYCLAKRKTRLYDSICVENGSKVCRYSFAGCGWGIISDMVKDYEKYRYLRQYRYWLLKGIHGCLCLRRHYSVYRYVPSENQARRCCRHKYPSVHSSCGLFKL